MVQRTESEIKAYVDGYNACYKDFTECMKNRKSLVDAVRKMDAIKAAVNATIVTEEGGRNVSESD